MRPSSSRPASKLEVDQSKIPNHSVRHAAVAARRVQRYQGEAMARVDPKTRRHLPAWAERVQSNKCSKSMTAAQPSHVSPM
eukprot:4752251-Pleurochrysis_carterae.AAC.4